MRNPHDITTANEIISSLRKNGFNAIVIGSIANKGFSEHDIDILVKLPYDQVLMKKHGARNLELYGLDKTSTNEELRLNKVLRKMGWKYGYDALQEEHEDALEHFDHYEKWVLNTDTEETEYLGLDVFYTY